MVTYFVVQGFERTKRGALAASLPIQAQSEAHAMRLAERIAATAAAVVAFSRSGDPSTGEYADAVILAAYGPVPELDADLAIAS